MVDVSKQWGLCLAVVAITACDGKRGPTAPGTGGSGGSIVPQASGGTGGNGETTTVAISNVPDSSLGSGGTLTVDAGGGMGGVPGQDAPPGSDAGMPATSAPENTGGVGGNGGTGGTRGQGGVGGGRNTCGTGPSTCTPRGNGGTGGTSGTGTGLTTLVQPIVRPNGNHVLEFGNIFFEVDPNVGARVVTLKYAGGANLLTTKADDADHFGSTFRLAPQSSWNSSGAPPPPEIDSQAYRMMDLDGYIWGESPLATSVGIAVRKLFFPGFDRKDTIQIEYDMKANADGKRFAAWEVTRVTPGGLTFYPTGERSPSSGSFSLPAIQNAAGCTWLTHPAQVSASSQRLLADSKEGWLAHITADGTVLIRQFMDTAISEQAPGEAEVAIYVDSGGKFIELEIYGAYRPVPNGLWGSWTTFWHLRKLPSTIAATVGNQTLVDWVRGEIR